MPELPLEVKSREDLKAEECDRCGGYGYYEINPLDDHDNRKTKCHECDNGLKYEKQCPKCGNWTLKWGDPPSTCNKCGYEDPAHPRYKEAKREEE